MDEFLHNIAMAVCGADPQLGGEWYELLGRSAPSHDDPEWSALVERLTEVSANAGAHTDGLMEALGALRDPAELQAVVAAMVWPETAEQAPAGADGAAQEDQDVWNAYLLTNGPRWDGTLASWDAFVEWFVYHADEQGVGGFARSFCAYATEGGPGEVFDQYGITLTASAEPAGEPEPPAAAGASATEEHGAGAAKPETAEEGAEGEDGMSVDEAVAEYGPALFAEFREANPELADMSDEDLSIVLAEVLDGQAELAVSSTE
jgi:hypothetical protein